MHDHTANLVKLLDSLTGLENEDKADILSEIKRLQKVFDKYEFKLTRIKKDKDVTINILNATIEDLEENKRHIERINRQLSRQKEELKMQKQIIEEKSAKLSENLRKLKLSYKEMEQFAYIASHDLKSPLRTISNFAQLLKRRNYDKLDDEAKEFIDYIVAGAVQMHEVICNSLEYSRVGNKEDQFDEIDLNEIVGSAVFNLKEDIREYRAEVIPETLPRLKANKTAILQLFQNLIGNAIKFRREAENPVVRITCRRMENHYEFRISDNGIGLDETFHHKVFLPFQRINAETKPGSGIGLAICKKIVKMHHGDIRYESAIGKGTTFVFTLRATPTNHFIRENTRKQVFDY